MNVLLWILQVVLALFCLAGGAYKLFQFDELAKVPATAALPRAVWGAIGVVEMLCAVLLIVPVAVKWMPLLTPLAAAVLAVEALALSVNNARYSLQLAVTNPLVWTLAMAAMASFVAWARYTLQD